MSSMTTINFKLICAIQRIHFKLIFQEKLNSTANVIVEIEDINDNNPEFERESYTADISETADPGRIDLKIDIQIDLKIDIRYLDRFKNRFLDRFKNRYHNIIYFKLSVITKPKHL